MESKNEFLKIDSKSRRCYYFDFAMEIIDINVKDLLLEKKRFENILIYDISYKTTFMGSIPLGSIKQMGY